MESFKKTKEVTPTVRTWCSKDMGIDFYINSGNNIPIYISRERLAEILIAESKNLIHIDDGYTWYREDSVLKKIEDSFNAARKYDVRVCEGISNDSIFNLHYKLFSDYMNSINNK